MNTGVDTSEFRLVEIVFPLFAVNPTFENAVIREKEVAWVVTCDFFVERIDDEWSELMVKVVITMRGLENNKKIAELITQSTYEVSTGISTEVKKTLLYITLNQTAAHAQGAWRVKHSNESIATTLPQALEHLKKDSKELKELLKQKWGTWSRK